MMDSPEIVEFRGSFCGEPECDSDRNNGIREVTWSVCKMGDLPRNVANDALHAADVMAESEGCEVLSTYEGREQVVRLETDGTSL